MTDKNVKFLMVLNDLDWFWSHRLPLAKAIQERGWALHVACAGAAENEALKQMGVVGHDLPPRGQGIFQKITEAFKRLWMLGKIIHTEKPDIVHAITLVFALYTGFVCRILNAGPVVFTVAGLGSLYTAPSLSIKILRLLIWPILAFAFKGKDRYLIFQNPDDLSVLVKARIVDEQQTTLIRGSGVDLTEFPFTPEPVSLTPKILFSSRLIREKGIYEYMQVAKHLSQRQIAAEFLIAGDVYESNPRSLRRAEVQDWHDRGIVNWLGHVSDMPDLIGGCAIFVLPSYYGEGVPKVMLEAAAIGRPIITCDMPGCREAVQDGVNGFLVPPRDVHALSDAVEKLLNDQSLRQKMGQAGRAHVEADFEVGTVVRKTLNVYDQALQGEAA